MNPKKLFEDEFGRMAATYLAKRPESQRLHQQAQSFMPGGDTRSVTFYRPFPSFMDHGKGCRLYDVDGNEYIDFGNNQTSLVHGHAHPKIVEAVVEQVRRGSVFPLLSNISFDWLNTFVAGSRPLRKSVSAIQGLKRPWGRSG